MNLYKAKTVVETLILNSELFAEKCAVVISLEGKETRFSYIDLINEARKFADWISERTKVGDRIVLALGTSPDFIKAFLGCLIAKRIAVPVPIEKSNRANSRVKSVIEDCEPRLVLFRIHSDYEKMKDSIGATKYEILQDAVYIKTDKTHTEVAPNSIAFIQYTSGSTHDPKGVVVTHSNLIQNIRMIQQGMSIDPDERVVSWLPLHHDMGLIGMFLTFISAGATTFIYPYQEFMRNPTSWLKYMATQKATLSGAPTFAFDLIYKKIGKLRTETVDLSQLRLLYCGSERIYPKTIKLFYQALSDSKLNPESFFPCYGLAEASLYVTGRFINAFQLIDHEVITCGRLANGLSLRIMLNENAVSPGEIGEIEISGSSVTAGYWRDISNKIESGVLSDYELKFIKTGDLGFLKDGELYVTGRTTDVFKVRGQNIFPEDIEFEIESLNKWFPTNGVIVLPGSTDESNVDGVVVVAEVHRGKEIQDYKKIYEDVQKILFGQGLRCIRLVLIAPISLPKTSSGKKQRQRAKQMLGDFVLKILWDSLEEKDNLTKKDVLECNADDIIEKIRLLSEYLATINMTLSDERRTFPADLLKILRQLGLLGLLIPQKFGGSGLGHSAFSVVGRSLANLDLSLGALVGNHNTIGVLPILYSSVLPDKNRVLESIGRDGCIAAFALTEPSAGSSPRFLTSTAKRNKGRIEINGEKVWVGNATYADYISIFVKEYDDNGVEIGISGFLLRKGIHSFKIGEEQLTLGLRAMPQARITLCNVIVTDKDRLTPPGEGLDLAFQAMEYARFGLAAISVGAIEAAQEIALSFAKSRSIWTGKLLDNEYFNVVNLEINLKKMALVGLIDAAANLLTKCGRLNQEISLSCKILAGEWGFESIDKYLQFCGGRGYTETFGLARIWRDIRVIRIFEGPTEPLSYQLGSLAMRQPEAVLESLNEIDTSIENEFKKYLEKIISQFNLLPHNILAVNIGLFAAEYIAMKLIAKQRPIANRYIEYQLAILEAKLQSSVYLQDSKITFDEKDNHNSKLKFNRPLFDCWPSDTSEPDDINKNTLQESKIKNIGSSDQIPKLFTFNNKLVLGKLDIQLKIQTWLMELTRKNEIDINKPIAEYGIDSLSAYEMLCFVEEEFGVLLPEKIIADKPSVAFLVAQISEEINKAKKIEQTQIKSSGDN